MFYDIKRHVFLKNTLLDRPKSIRHSGAVAARSALRNQSYPPHPNKIMSVFYTALMKWTVFKMRMKSERIMERGKAFFGGEMSLRFVHSSDLARHDCMIKEEI